MKTKREKFEGMNRRDFLKTAGIITAGTVLASACSSNIGTGSIEGVTAEDLSVASDTGPHQTVALAGVERNASEAAMIQAVQETVLQTTDFSWLKQGDDVFIKPAVNSGNRFPATTSPLAVRAVVELIKEKGAGRVIVSDMSGIEYVKLTEGNLKGSSRQLMESSGISQAAIEAGAELYFPEEQGWDAFVEELPRDRTYWQGGIMMPKILQEVEHVVLMPRCSRHLLLGSSLGLKCAVGYWRTDSRFEYHRYASTIQEKTADANTVPSLLNKQRLVISDATQMITRFGPDNGFIAKPETGLMIASQDVVAHDMVSLAWLLINRSAMTEEERAESRDPYTNQFAVSNLNRFVVSRLGELKHILGTEKLVRNDLNTIWDDRVLKRAFEVFGGVPQLDLVNVKDTVPEDLLISLDRMVTQA
mgnify:FL=1